MRLVLPVLLPQGLLGQQVEQVRLEGLVQLVGLVQQEGQVGMAFQSQLDHQSGSNSMDFELPETELVSKLSSEH